MQGYSRYMMSFIRLVLLCGISCLFSGHVFASRMHEPTCTSKFDYDFKMLKTLVDLERRQDEMLATIQKQQEVIRVLETEKTAYGTTYTVWGKKTCPANGSSLVYSGFMAGPHHNDGGTGSNYLCLTDQPEWSYYVDGVVESGRIFGAEYNFWEHRSTGASKFLGKNVLDKNVPCAVCHVTRGSHIMIPGRTSCFGGWTKEYSGYLVSGYYGHKHASEYVCLAADVDFVDGNEQNDDRTILYFVESICGALHCPPYVNGRELTCVVCSR